MTTAILVRRLLGRGIAGSLMLLLAVALFELVFPPVADAFGGEAGLERLVDQLPPLAQTLIQAQSGLLGITSLAGYLSTGYTHPLYLTLASATLVGFAARSLAGEMERGTIQLALARPVSRWRVYGARVIGVAAFALALSVAGPLGMTVGMLIARPDGELHYDHLPQLGLTTLALFWAIGGVTLFGSAAASTTGRVVAWAIAGLVASYFVDFFAAIWSALEPFEPLSIFGYYDPASALVRGTVPVENVVVLGVTGAVGALAGLAVFVRRDLPT